MRYADVCGPIGSAMAILGLIIVGGSRGIEWLFVGGFLVVVGLGLWWARG